MSVWDDEDAELLLRAGDSPSTVARLLGMDIERIEGIAAERSRAKPTLEDRQRIGEIRRELRGENPEPKPEPKPPKAPKAPPAATRTTRMLGLRSDRGEPWSSAGMGSMLAVAREREAIGTPDTAEQAACGAMFDAGAEVAGHLRARLRKNLAIEDAHRERDEAIAEMERINALLTKEQDLRWAERKDSDEKIERFKAERDEARAERDLRREDLAQALERYADQIETMAKIQHERDEARRERDEARSEVERLTRELDALKIKHQAIAAEADLLDGRLKRNATESREKHQADQLRAENDQLRASLADVSNLRATEQRAAMADTHPAGCESCGRPTSRTRVLVGERNEARAKLAEAQVRLEAARRALESYQPDWEELAARRAGTWIEPKESK